MEHGVTIGFREIYDKVLEVGEAVRSLDERMSRVEKRLEDVDIVDERSREAFEMAKDALKEVSEIKENITWLKRTFVGAVITAVVAVLIGAATFIQ